MNVALDSGIVSARYTSNSQIARVATEYWVKQNSYCPSCGNEYLTQFDNNKPVADFFCQICSSEFELKSQKDSFSSKINDGAYQTMIQRINSNNNPHFFFLNYSLQKSQVLNFLVIPKHYFTDEIIEKRKPLAPTARRAGWVGCNILLQNIPSNGKIFLVRNGAVEKREAVLETWRQTSFLANQSKEKRGWTIEILKVLDQMNTETFTLKAVYQFEESLKVRFPNNNFIKDKIRQQLQFLRDKGVIEFTGNGNYRRLGRD